MIFPPLLLSRKTSDVFLVNPSRIVRSDGFQPPKTPPTAATRQLLRREGEHLEDAANPEPIRRH
jgi:hypothetical protein